MSVQNIQAYGPAPTDKNGVLAAFVQQPITNTPAEVSKNRVVYTEKWKGPYEKGKTVLSTVKVGDNLNITTDGVLSAIGGGAGTSNYNDLNNFYINVKK